MKTTDSLYFRASAILERCAENIGCHVAVTEDEFFILVTLHEDGLVSGSLVGNGIMVKGVTSAGLRFIDEANSRRPLRRALRVFGSIAVFLLGFVFGIAQQTIANWFSPRPLPYCGCHGCHPEDTTENE